MRENLAVVKAAIASNEIPHLQTLACAAMMSRHSLYRFRNLSCPSIGLHPSRPRPRWSPLSCSPSSAT
ncbi:hypothetical protein EMIT047CA2_220032 [Pseudomonas soli]